MTTKIDRLLRSPASGFEQPHMNFQQNAKFVFARLDIHDSSTPLKFDLSTSKLIVNAKNRGELERCGRLHIKPVRISTTPFGLPDPKSTPA
ncbi:hypothetical protein AVEN_217465-1 [Araneus ventricosus]|uniref:Uncharacterized protein n=1 Tax=Araneus ventricosus TaxID=182803 RepID=A0A4Y2PIN5_ARAVE|nr:hypothetical protein AVEN_217465-1 [Araneus ventricosus]